MDVSPENINSPEAILHYLRQSPKDSLKKSAADLIESLQAKVSSPLVVVTDEKSKAIRMAIHTLESAIFDTEIDELRNQCIDVKTYLQNALSSETQQETAPSDNFILREKVSSFLNLMRFRVCLTKHDEELAGKLRKEILSALSTTQVSPQETVSLPISLRDMNLEQPADDAHRGAWYQNGYSWGWNEAIRAIQSSRVPMTVQATVEPLTDEQIFAVHDSLFPRAVAGRSEIIKFARALLATPPASKATFDEAHLAAMGDAMRHGTGMIRMSADGVQHIPYNEFALPMATSKADTVDRNAVLDRCADGFRLCFSPTEKLDVQYVIDSILACKSATPSTIKAEPTGEQL